MLGATEQGLWVDYIFLDPATGNQEYKHAWAVRRDGLLFAPVGTRCCPLYRISHPSTGTPFRVPVDGPLRGW